MKDQGSVVSGQSSVGGNPLAPLLALPPGSKITHTFGSDPGDAVLHVPGEKPVKVREHVNPTPLLNRQAVREFILETAKKQRPFNKFSRVSEETLVAINAQLRVLIVGRVKQAPSKGVTL